MTKEKLLKGFIDFYKKGDEFAVIMHRARLHTLGVTDEEILEYITSLTQSEVHQKTCDPSPDHQSPNQSQI